MTIISETVFKPEAFEAVLQILSQQNHFVRPSESSSSEDSARAPFDIGNADKNECISNYLWSDRVGYNFSISRNGMSSLFAFGPEPDDIAQLCVSFLEIDIEFVYACSEAEREHRNWIRYEAPYGLHEGWVGTDYELYLPGLYWITAFPVSYQQRNNLDMQNIRDVSKEVKIEFNKNIFIRLYDKPNDWIAQKKVIDELCSSNPNCFHKDVAQRALSGVNRFSDVADILSRYP